MIVLKAKAVGAAVTLENSPVIASGSVETVQIEFIFDDAWDGTGKVALFWGEDGETSYSSVLVNNIAIVPHEAITEKGKLKFGVYGVNAEKRIVSQKVVYKVEEGAWDSEAQSSVTPTQTLLDQIITALGELQHAKDEIVQTVQDMTFAVNENMELLVTV